MRAILNHNSALLGVLVLLGPALAAPQGSGAERVDELLARIRARGNGVEVEVLEELGGLKSREALEALEKGTGLMKSPRKVFAAQRAFRHFAQDAALAREAARFLAERTELPRELLARNAAYHLGALMPHAVDAAATVVEKSDDGDCRALALMHLVDADLPLDEARLERWTRARDELVRYEALRALVRRPDEEGERARRLAELERSRDAVERLAACQLLADLQIGGAGLRLCARLGDEHPRVRRKALACLEEIPAREAVPGLIEVLEASEEEPARRIAALLGRLTGVRLGTDPARWRGWWEAEGPGFQPLKERKAKPAGGEDLPRSRASFYGLPVDSKRVVFAVDASDSMQHAMPGTTAQSRIAAAKSQLRQAIEKLDDDARFDLVHFGGGARAWQGELVRVSRGTRKQALEHVESIELSFGTDIYGGLHEAFRDPEVDTILFLTDGAPYLGAVDDRAGLRRVVRQWNATRHVTLHCIAIGQERGWLRRLAEESGGRYVCLK